MGALGTVSGTAGNDTINGGSGIDEVSYAHGPANKGIVIDLAAGTATTTTGSDLLISIEKVTGSNQADTIFGSSVANSINGNGGIDTLDGRGGNDALRGGNDNDTISGGTGLDSLLGDSGDDILNGGSGNDSLRGSSGKDRSTGGAGADTFVYDFSDLVVGAARDSVTDFSHAQTDKVDLKLIDADSTDVFVDTFVFQGTTALTGAA